MRFSIVAIAWSGILAAMTIASPPGVTAVSAFNGDFFTAVATLIPVLFLALAVQRDTFVHVLRGYQRFLHPPVGQRHPSPLAKTPFIAALVVLPLCLAGAVIAGAWGEPLAIYALYQRQAQYSTQLIVLVSAIFLAIGTTAVAGVTFTGAMVRTRPHGTDDTPDAKKPAAEGEPASGGTQPRTSEAGNTAAG